MKENKMQKYMTIGILADDPSRAGVNISPELTLTEAFQLLGTLASHILHVYREVAIHEDIHAKDQLSQQYPNEFKDTITEDELTAAITGITESMYDAADNVFSTVLQNFYPEAAKYSIEDEAILKLTNELIEKRYNSLSTQEKKEYARTYNKMKLRFQMTPHNTQTQQSSDVDDRTREATPTTKQPAEQQTNQDNRG